MTQRFRNGLQFLVSYTYGKSLDYGGSAASGGGAVGNGQTVTNIEAWHGPSGFDTAHRAVISWVYELPFGARATVAVRMAAWGRIVGGWQLAGIATMTTGGPSPCAGDRRQQRRAQLAKPDRIGQRSRIQRSIMWFNTGGLRGAAGQHIR